jgi:hypothetical protein
MSADYIVFCMSLSTGVVYSGTGLCDVPILRQEEPCRMWCVIVYDLETSSLRRTWTVLNCSPRRGGEKLNYELINSRTHTLLEFFSNNGESPKMFNHKG